MSGFWVFGHDSTQYFQPIEIFDIIVSHLPESECKTLFYKGAKRFRDRIWRNRARCGLEVSFPDSYISYYLKELCNLLRDKNFR